ncbi:MAG: mechanosensitive ion channel [Flavobacteriia bacterium]|nr:mechanosensitive ion channel [Flavobacteriia bacterium]
MLKFIENLFGIEYADVNVFFLRLGTKLAIALSILIFGLWAVKIATKAIKKILRKSKTDESLVTFLSSLVSMAFKALVVITAITQLGVEMTSFVAILGAAGLAVGMAFSGTLSNFAGGVMILIFKPFKVGDVILTQGEQGTVKEIQIFNTYLHTSDNKVIILPNGPIANGNITNFTKAEKRRVDLIYGIAYGDNVQVARDTLNEIINTDTRIIQDPAPFIGLGALTNNSVDIVVRVWTLTDDYWPVYFDLNEKVYKEFEKHGLHFPAPSTQLVVNNEM